MARDKARKRLKETHPLAKLFAGLVFLVVLTGSTGGGFLIVASHKTINSLEDHGVPPEAVDMIHQVREAAWELGGGLDLRYRMTAAIWHAKRLASLNFTQTVSIDLPPVSSPEQKPAAKTNAAPKPEAREAGEDAARRALEAEKATPEAEKADPEEEERARREAEAAGAANRAEEEAMAETAARTAEPAVESEPAPPSEAAPAAEAATPPRSVPLETAALSPELVTPDPAPVPEAVPAAPARPAQPTDEERLQQADLDYKQGLSYYRGVDREQNDKEAAKLFGRAALGGHAGAQYSLGLMHYLGRGLDQNFEKAAEWFQRAADKNHAGAQYNLGIMYYQGQGVGKDDRTAFKWISEAARNGDKKAQVARDALSKALPEDVTKPPPAGS